MSWLEGFLLFVLFEKRFIRELVLLKHFRAKV